MANVVRGAGATAYFRYSGKPAVDSREHVIHRTFEENFGTRSLCCVSILILPL